MEEWRIIDIAPDYEVSNLGRVRHGERILTSELTRSGYLRMAMGVGRRAQIHRLVATAFIPNPKDLPEADHLNHDRTDNRVENLEWKSKSANCRNRIKKSNTNEDYIHIRATGKGLKRVVVQMPINGRPVRKNFYTLEDAIEYRDQILSTA